MSISSTSTTVDCEAINIVVVAPATVKADAVSFAAKLRSWLKESWLTIRKGVAASFTVVKDYMTEFFTSVKGRVSEETWNSLKTFFNNVLGFVDKAATLSASAAYEFYAALGSNNIWAVLVGLAALLGATLVSRFWQGLLLLLAGEVVMKLFMAAFSIEFQTKVVDERGDEDSAFVRYCERRVAADAAARLARATKEAKAQLAKDGVIVDDAPVSGPAPV